MKLTQYKTEQKTIRMTPETLEFLQSQGRPAMVINAILKKSIANWEEFEKLPD